MKKICVYLMIAVLAVSFIACGKDGKDGKTGSTGTAMDAKDGQKDGQDAKKPEDKKIEPTTVDNLFKVLDKAIKDGQFAKARALFTPASLAKISNPDSADFLGDTLYGQIQFEVKNRYRFKKNDIQAAGAGMTRKVTWPSKKVTTVAVQKVGKFYKLDIMKSSGGDSLE